MFSDHLVWLGRALAVWCRVLAYRHPNSAQAVEYGRLGDWLERAAGAVQLEVEFVRSLQGANGRLSASDEALVELFARFEHGGAFRNSEKPRQ